MTVFYQKEVNLKPVKKGFHLITDQLLSSLPGLGDINVGLLHVFLKHTSASLTINENADSTVRTDMVRFFDKMVPDNEPYFDHISEGSDDMSAHLKTVLTGSEITIPVSNGQLNLGMWQGIYLCEHRLNGGSRSVVLTLCGEKKI